MHSEELHGSNSSSNVTGVSKSGGKRWPGHVACKEEWRGAHRVLVGKLRERGHQEDMRRWEYNIGMDLKCNRLQGLYWTDLAHDRDKCRAVVNKVMNLPSVSTKYWEFLD